MKMIDDKSSYRSSGPSPPNQNTDRKCLPSSPGKEFMTLFDDLVDSLLRYCEDVTLAIFWGSTFRSVNIMVLSFNLW